jgi:hypothetical protein
MATKLIVGEKYVPHSKNGSVLELETSSEWAHAKKKGQPYMYYTGLYDDEFHCFSYKMSGWPNGDFFTPEDVTEFGAKKPTIHEMILKERGIEVGDTVRVSHRVQTHDLGWTNSWIPEYMDPFIGKEGVVTKVDPSSGVEVHSWNFPAHAVELVSKKRTPINIKLNSQYTAIVDPDGTVSVGCQTIPFEAVEEVWAAIQSMK